jgi:phosphatidylinositol transfer protein SFH5
MNIPTFDKSQGFTNSFTSPWQISDLLSSKSITMSAEPGAAMAATTGAVSSIEERNNEAAEAPSQTPAAPAPVAEDPVKEEKTPEASEAPEAPSKTEPAPGSDVQRPVLPLGTPLSRLFAELPSIIADTQYTEMWGVELTNSADAPSSIVLEKFLRANTQDVAKAKAQLTEALKWRKQMQPQKLLAETQFNEAKFGGLGFVTVYPKTDSHEKEIVTWNIYGGVKSKQETFGDVQEYVDTSR